MTASKTKRKDADTRVDDEVVDVDDGDIDDEDLDLDDALDDDALDDDALDDDADVLVGDDDDEDDDEDDATLETKELSDEAGSKRPTGAKTDDEGMDLEEEHHPDDVEEPLDVVLRERTATPEDSDEPTSDNPPDGPRRITPRGSDEFLCSSCFLVLPHNQLADEKNQLCRDCV